MGEIITISQGFVGGGSCGWSKGSCQTHQVSSDFYNWEMPKATKNWSSKNFVQWKRLWMNILSTWWCVGCDSFDSQLHHQENPGRQDRYFILGCLCQDEHWPQQIKIGFNPTEGILRRHRADYGYYCIAYHSRSRQGICNHHDQLSSRESFILIRCHHRSPNLEFPQGSYIYLSLKMKFPTKRGIDKVWGEQTLARECCYMHEMKTRGSNVHAHLGRKTHGPDTPITTDESQPWNGTKRQGKLVVRESKRTTRIDWVKNQ